MRGALIHGVLLAVMLIYGYRTWTRDKTADSSAVRAERASVAGNAAGNPRPPG